MIAYVHVDIKTSAGEKGDRGEQGLPGICCFICASSTLLTEYFERRILIISS